ncbi:MAG: hypothetical protein M3Y20_08750, partial [Actinomycetota bacterium]|nr:hypothetical protein [Actinomycetota bacterium]
MTAADLDLLEIALAPGAPVQLAVDGAVVPQGTRELELLDPENTPVALLHLGARREDGWLDAGEPVALRALAPVPGLLGDP